MNKIIARLYAQLLNFCHVLFAVGLVVGLAYISIADPSPTGMSLLWNIMIVISFFLGYLIVMGALSTLVAIKEHLESIDNKLAAKEQPDPMNEDSKLRPPLTME